ncbi:twin-arginine translocase subunit TatC [Halanaeroarchaeum sulfurireducens]|uniref:Sec-independent protein translocase protein TatC n=1 Tax=Halanaeroarchaeum sulfurireducens TaxID=1604004 RepID=A0A0F7PGW2_9EURY|nr:twin-arginine translocase subunit TatC [Halanaeroarchaeum sulfurireducens]AKH98523.1 sec-independent protein translocase component TatC 2 [Halanaeroarchaeum sulfurireducens]
MSGGVSEYVDEDTARSIETGRQTLGVALRTAQERLQKVFIAFVVGMLGAIIAMRSYVWPQFKADLLAKGASVIAQTPFDVILLQVKIGLVVGVFTAIPVLAYYGKEPLVEREIIPDVSVARWKLVVLLVMALALAVGGSVYAYFLFFPLMFQFLAGNALGAGLAPMYSIVDWTEFIMVLAFSFALAAQLPLVMTALSVSGIVPYEVFREKWKYAVVAIFGFGALFSPPDPFTQMMWSLPLLALYGFSLYLSRVVTVAYRGRSQISVTGAILERWNHVVGAAVLGGGIPYVFFSAGGVRIINESVRPALPAAIRPGPLPGIGTVVGMGRPEAILVVAVLSGLLVAVVAAMVVAYAAIVAAEDERSTDLEEEFDLSRLSVAGVRSAPAAVFEDLTEAEAVAAASEAMDENDPQKAEAILERFDEVREPAQEEGESEEASGDPVANTTAGMVNAFTEDETTEDDIGGYWHDISFILDSLRSRAFRLASVFLLTMAGIFTFLYRGGIGMIRADFLSRIPEAVRPEPAETAWPITLHPVEALVFEVKIATVIAAIVTVPFVLYYAWPALEERGIIGGDRRYITLWGITITVGLIVGSVLGYQYVAPSIISYLVYDALQAGMIISYRVNNFFWMVFLTTAGIGLLADVPVSMLLFHRGGLVPYRAMREHWRVAVLSTFVIGTVLTPGSLYTMLLVALPLSFAYLFGLGILWVLTLGGRRGGGPPAEQPA